MLVDEPSSSLPAIDRVSGTPPGWDYTPMSSHGKQKSPQDCDLIIGWGCLRYVLPHCDLKGLRI